MLCTSLARLCARAVKRAAPSPRRGEGGRRADEGGRETRPRASILDARFSAPESGRATLMPSAGDRVRTVSRRGVAHAP